MPTIRGTVASTACSLLATGAMGWPASADQLDAVLEVPGLGAVKVDVAFGGMWYAIADPSALRFTLDASEARELSRVGKQIRAAAREQVHPIHPENPAIVPVIRDSAWITGITQVYVDPTDPFPEGYLLSDTWPGSDSQD